jgi:hypothetical protein
MQMIVHNSSNFIASVTSRFFVQPRLLAKDIRIEEGTIDTIPLKLQKQTHRTLVVE